MNKTEKAFNFAGNSGMYDGVITGTGIFGGLVSNIVWKMNKETDLKYQRMAKSGVPKDFSGKMLEVPVGTGILTMPMYKELCDADITCLDCSEAMMAAAKRRAAGAGLRNVTFVRGDVGALPF
ncbi:MAG: methyltransferase domain-containing protein, partial [Clostridia bacterium]|nr:methyltransferase domain-containing protein [Clostridia bacterium]